jgi:hypothetical protein
VGHMRNDIEIAREANVEAIDLIDGQTVRLF